jgi:hypothetical protein
MKYAKVSFENFTGIRVSRRSNGHKTFLVNYLIAYQRYLKELQTPQNTAKKATIINNIPPHPDRKLFLPNF